MRLWPLGRNFLPAFQFGVGIAVPDGKGCLRKGKGETFFVHSIIVHILA